MKPHIINKENLFLKGWYIRPQLCDEMIEIFRKNKNLQQAGNLDTGAKEGKVSTDISIDPTNMDVVKYTFALKDCVTEYKKLYPVLDINVDKWAMKEFINIQRYQPNESFSLWHTESANLMSSHRMLVFMTYLNTVEEGGETEWFHQKLKIKPEKGLTVLWPADWTYLHRGCPALNEIKYITTGWFSYI